MSDNIQNIASQLAKASAQHQNSNDGQLHSHDFPAHFIDSNGQKVKARVLVTFLQPQKSGLEK